MKWAGNVERLGERRVHTGFWWGRMSERDHVEGLRVDGSIILK
jgi:hypothetical protein